MKNIKQARLPQAAYDGERSIADVQNMYGRKSPMEMKVINEYPPNIEEIKKRFKIHDATVFTWGDIIFYPRGAGSVNPHVLVHEQVHQKQQNGNPEKWWTKYIDNAMFRFNQEIEAYRVQYKYVLRKKNRNEAYMLLLKFARDLSGELYGHIVSYEKALEMIKQ